MRSTQRLDFDGFSPVYRFICSFTNGRSVSYIRTRTSAKSAKPFSSSFSSGNQWSEFLPNSEAFPRHRGYL